MSMPSTEPIKVPGKGIASAGGKTGSLQHMHNPADEMASHDTGLMSGAKEFSWPGSPPHSSPNLGMKPIAVKGDDNMSPGLGPIPVPGKGL